MCLNGFSDSCNANQRERGKLEIKKKICIYETNCRVAERERAEGCRRERMLHTLHMTGQKMGNHLANKGTKGGKYYAGLWKSENESLSYANASGHN